MTGSPVSATKTNKKYCDCVVRSVKQGEPTKRPLLSIRFYNGEFFVAVRTSLLPESLSLTLQETV
jgi:hypothetical protein